MLVTGADTSYIAVLLNTSDFKWHEVKRHEPLCENIVALTGKFWHEYVEPKKHPRVDGTFSTTRALSDMYSETESREHYLGDRYAEYGKRYERLNVAISHANKTKAQLANEIRHEMGSAEFAVLPDGTGFRWSGEKDSRRFTRVKKVISHE